MDGDLVPEPQLDYFNQILPLPYRLALAIILGIWAWGVNLQYLSKNKIDTLSLIHPRTSSRTQASNYLSTYLLAAILSGLLVIFTLLSWTLCFLNFSPAIYHDLLPIVCLIFLFITFILQARRLFPSGRSLLLASFRRIMIGGLAQSKDGRFADVLLSDVLTSYAKVIADLFVVFCMFFRTPSTSETAGPVRTCGGQYWVPIITAIPSLIRLRQCLIEFIRVQSAGGPGWGGQHLANALKYASALPVIIFSILQRNMDLNHNNTHLTNQSINYCWLVSILVNSLYSFYWDVAKDWDLSLFPALIQILPFPRHTTTSMRPNLIRSSKNCQFGLRPRLCFPSSDIYYMAIFFDLIIRFSWSLRLSSTMNKFINLESGILLLELAEVARRWVWMFLRIESEWIRQSEELSHVEIENLLAEDNITY